MKVKWLVDIKAFVYKGGNCNSKLWWSLVKLFTIKGLSMQKAF